MKRKTAIIITILTAFLAMVGLAAWYFFLSPQTIKNDQGGISKIISTFFPIGEQTTNNQQPTTTEAEKNNGEENLNENQPAPVIRKITSSAVAGFTIIEDKKDSSSVRYMESETGNVYNAPLAIISNTRLTNTTIPKVREAVFLPNGEQIIARYLDDDEITIKSFSGKINLPKTGTGSTTEGELRGDFLRDDIVNIVATEENKIFYTIVESNAISGILANTDGSKPTKVFSSIILEWLPQWIGKNSLYVNTKASSKSPGYIFKINTSNGDQTKVIGKVFGLTSNFDPKNTEFVYNDSSLKLYSYKLKTEKVSELPLKTLAEKCAWETTSDTIIYCGIPDKTEPAEYPDDWYKGIISFKDDLWKMNLTTGEITLITQFSQTTGGDIDIINPKISKDGNYFVFTNKNDLSLWSVRVR